MSVEMSYEDLPDGVVRVTLDIDAQALLSLHEDVARILVRDLLRNALLQRQQGLRRDLVQRGRVARRPLETEPLNRDMIDALALYSAAEQRTRVTDLALLHEQQVAQSRAMDQQNRENRVRYYEELRRIMSEPNPILFDGLTFAERRNPGYRYDVNNPFEPMNPSDPRWSTGPARGCESHIFTDPACTDCTANQGRRKTKPKKLNPTHPLNALDGERE